METLESSRMCRLCGKHSGISINIFDKNENHIRKINAVLPIMVHEMDLLPKHMCHRCSYKLEEFHKFYVDCLRTDADLKSQLSWMRKESGQESKGVPMVQIENVKIKAEPPDYDIYELDPIAENVSYIKSMSSMTFPANTTGRNGIHEGLAYSTYARCGCYYNKGPSNRRVAGRTYARAAKEAESRSEASVVDRNDPATTTTTTTTRTTTSHAQIVGRDPFGRGEDPPNGRPEEDERTWRTAVDGKETGAHLSADDDDSADRRKRGASRATRNAIVRNLRPRKGSIDYVGTRRKSSSPRKTGDAQIRSKSADGKMRFAAASTDYELVVQVKTESCNDNEGRTLRPRTKVVDYLGRKRKDPSVAVGQRRSKSEEHATKRAKSNVNDTDSWIPTIKTEETSADDEFDNALQKQLFANRNVANLPRSKSNRISVTRAETRLNANDSVAALPSNVLIKVEDNINENPSTNPARFGSNLDFADKLKSLRKEKNEKSSKSAAAKRKPSAHFSPKYLRSQDAHLRSGKIKKFDGSGMSVKRLRWNLHHITAGSRAVNRKLLKVIKENVCAKNASGPEKLLDIKHYCEKCSVSFANKELYKLHGCYYD